MSEDWIYSQKEVDKIISEFLESLRYIKNYYKDYELFKLTLIDEEIDKWQKRSKK